MRMAFVSLFPEVLTPILDASILGRAQQNGLVTFESSNPRNFTYDAHRKVDDRPYGGDAGMVICAEPVALAIESLNLGPNSAVVLPDPAARTFQQHHAKQLSRYHEVCFVCGHYEGIDNRIRTQFATHVFSIGDYVLTGGELPALVMADAIIRLLEGSLGSTQSLEQDSFSDQLLSAPQFTRPESWRGHRVPAVLTKGNHAETNQWKRAQSLQITLSYRPDLLAAAEITERDLEWIKQQRE
jgi:tRNA (guanine37-N1)-methyltransferase